VRDQERSAVCTVVRLTFPLVFLDIKSRVEATTDTVLAPSPFFCDFGSQRHGCFRTRHVVR
jgi:hypothetical protein